MCQKTWKWLQPSTLAAFSSSFGIVRMYWRIRKMKKALAKNDGTISGR